MTRFNIPSAIPPKSTATIPEIAQRIGMHPDDAETIVRQLGIASGFSNIRGIAMNLGGGSMQITWLISQNGNVRMGPRGSCSFPYGAATLTKTLENLREDKTKDEADRAVGWIVWLDTEYLPEELVFNINYLGADQASVALNFHAPS
jgi:hypothetical protein